MFIKYRILPTIGISLAFTLLASCKPAKPAAKSATPAEIEVKIQSLEKLTLVHVWATWCDPCREEFPELVAVMKEFPTLDVVLISGDDPSEIEDVNAFLREYESPVGSLVSTKLNQQFIEAFSPNWAGSLPATFFFNDGRLIEEWEGKRTFEQYAEVIKPLLKQ